ncbi:hypothetical protein MMC07_005472 [Pseudocyphellaria aurata]|nr:hypothetical protein [Pseudocyphellaria aurata]
MKRKRSIANQGRPQTRAATRSAQTSHKPFQLLLLPRELRILILRNLLYSAEPLGRAKGIPNRNLFHKRQSSRNFTFYPAILRVCRQVYNEGYEILYRHNIATASITSWHDDSTAVVMFLDDILLPLYIDEIAIAGHFSRWDVTLRVNLDVPKDVTDTIYYTIFDYLRPNPNLDVLTVRLKPLDDPYNLGSSVAFDNSQDLEELAEQVFRPFSTLRVRQVEFVDEQGHSIRTTLSLARLMMSDSPPPITLHELWTILAKFLQNSLTEKSYRVMKARLHPLRIARDFYDVDAFYFALRPILSYLCIRGLVPPKQVAEFAQGSAPMGWITDRVDERDQSIRTLN